jgi:hypothetical protein
MILVGDLPRQNRACLHTARFGYLWRVLVEGRGILWRDRDVPIVMASCGGETFLLPAERPGNKKCFSLSTARSKILRQEASVPRFGG